jgi:hypothetical protein
MWMRGGWFAQAFTGLCDQESRIDSHKSDQITDSDSLLVGGNTIEDWINAVKLLRACGLMARGGAFYHRIGVRKALAWGYSTVARPGRRPVYLALA